MGQCWSGLGASVRGIAATGRRVREDRRQAKRSEQLVTPDPDDTRKSTPREGESGGIRQDASGNEPGPKRIRFPGLFRRTIRLPRDPHKYSRQDDDRGRQEPAAAATHVSSIELTDIVPPHQRCRNGDDSSNPAAYYQPHQSKAKKNRQHQRPQERDNRPGNGHGDRGERQRKGRQPQDLRQVAGLRSALAYCTMRSSRSYRQFCESSAKAENDPKSKPLSLDPRHLPYSTLDSPPLGSSLNSLDSCCGRHEGPNLGRLECSHGNRGRSISSVDLEWENNEDIMVPSFQTDVCVDLNGSVASLPTAAATITATTVCSSVAANGNGSRASSRASLPGLDWDEQGDSADLVSLRDMCLGADDVTTTAVGNPLIGDVETEQLLSEIELLTSRTLHETNQWRATAEAATVEVRGSGSENNCNSSNGGNTAAADNNNTWTTIDIVGNADTGVSGLREY